MNKKNLRYIWLGLTAILLLFVGGRWNVPMAAWLAPVFAIRFFRESERAGQSFLLLWLATAIPIIIAWRGATFLSFIHPAAEAGFFLLLTPISLIPYVIDRLYYRRFGSTYWLSLVYPVAATAMDFFSSSGSPFGTFGAAAYSQRGFLPIMQLASVTGLWGITFVINWFGSLVNYVWENGFKFDRAALTSGALLVFILTLGWGRTLFAAQPEPSAQVAGFSLREGSLSGLLGQIQAMDEKEFRQAIDEIHAQELDQIRALARQGAGIISLQEGAGMGYPDQVAKLLANAARLAKEEQIYIVMPTFTLGLEKPENAVHILDLEGEIVLKHLKFGGTQFEGSLTGSGELQTVDTPYGRISAVICWDADFPNVIKQAGAQKVDLLFVPSNDWLAVKDIHAGMAAFRAVENGLTIFRQTGAGVSVVTDAYGRTLQRMDFFEDEPTGDFAAVQSVQTPVHSVTTLYPVIGDLIGNLMLLLAVGLLPGPFLKRKQSATQPGIESISA